MCVHFPAWEGVVPWMYWGGFSAEGETWNICVLHTAMFNFVLARGVGGAEQWVFLSELRYISTLVWWGNGQWGLEVLQSGPGGSRMWWLGSRAFLRLQNCHDQPRAARVLLSPTSGKWHHLIQADSRRWFWTQNSFLEPVVKECGAKESLLKGWALFWMWASVCLSQSFNDVSKWSEHSWSLQKLSVNRQELLLLWCLGR